MKWERENVTNVFRPHYAGEIWKRNNHRSFWIFVWKNIRAGKSRDYRDVTVFEKPRFQDVFRPH